MDVIKIDSNRTAPVIAGWTGKVGFLDVSGVLSVLGKLLLCILAAWSVIGGRSALAINVPVKPIAIITVDDEGRDLSFPTNVFFDPVEKELYVSDSGRDRIVVYGPDFFPRISIARGRGVMTPRGMVVMRDGEVYVCQPRNIKKQRASITVLNAAFFVDREIFLDKIPGAAGLIPDQIAVSSDGTIYLAGTSTRGVLVLDREGNLLRRLQPLDTIKTMVPVESAEDEKKEPEEEDPLLANIPAEFRPKKAGNGNTRRSVSEGLGPVKIDHVTIDSNGRLYLMSHETGHIYVYGPDESFLFKFGQKGGSPGQMSTPKSMAIDENRGLIYVSDYMRHAILVYDMAGKYLFEFGGQGFGPGWFNYPMGLTINDNGQLIVADLFNNRVQVLEVGYDAISPSAKNRTSKNVSPDSSASADSAGQEESAPAAQPAGAGNGEISLDTEKAKGQEITAVKEIQEQAPEAEISTGQNKPEVNGDQEGTEETGTPSDQEKAEPTGDQKEKLSVVISTGGSKTEIGGDQEEAPETGNQSEQEPTAVTGVQEEAPDQPVDQQDPPGQIWEEQLDPNQ